MSAEKIYHETTNANLSEPDDAGDTNVEGERPTEATGPIFIRHKDKGIPPRALSFATSTIRPAVAATSTPYPQLNK